MFQNQSVIQLNSKSSFIIFFLLSSAVMPEYTKVYIKNKKESNISLPLRYSLLRSIFVQNMSVKNAALKWKVHYSSAKIIARTAKRNKLYYMFEKDQASPKPTKQCSYRELTSTEIKEEPSPEENQSYRSNNGESLTHFSLLGWNKIQILSTIGWTYQAQNLQNLQLSS